jgi:hypothetical protein
LYLLITKENVDNVVNLLSSECVVLTVNPDEPSDQYTTLSRKVTGSNPDEVIGYFQLT